MRSPFKINYFFISQIYKYGALVIKETRPAESIMSYPSYATYIFLISEITQIASVCLVIKRRIRVIKWTEF